MTETSRPEVSVVIAAYNCADFVDRAIQSALGQQGPALEVIVVDDASRDDTALMVTKLADQDSRIRLIKLPQNGGPSAARNAGFAAAAGDWIAVLDADDSYEPGRLERLLHLGREFEADMVADNIRYYDARTGLAGPPGLKEGGAPELIDRYGFLNGARPYSGEVDFGLLKPLFRRAFIEAHMLSYPLNARHGEDFLLYMAIMLRSGRFVLSRTPGYLYTTRDSGLSRTIIDYEGQLGHLAALRLRPDVAGDSRLTTLLDARANGLMRLAAEQQLQSLIEAKDAAGLVPFALRNSWNAGLVLDWARRAVARKSRFAARRLSGADGRSTTWS